MFQDPYLNLSFSPIMVHKPGESIDIMPELNGLAYRSELSCVIPSLLTGLFIQGRPPH